MVTILCSAQGERIGKSFSRISGSLFDRCLLLTMPGFLDFAPGLVAPVLIFEAKQGYVCSTMFPS
jgi:hypothetical protein